ncbi:MAG: hypothetical protein CR986_10265 [Ignavibacteriae bacterium]|nr:MAG: hypothetical protein CR986_10265 [Ignavibacteriota bacterium]
MKNITWITGASAGIGKALVKKFNKEDINVIATSRRLNKLQEISKELNGSAEFSVYSNDVAKFIEVKELVEKIAKDYNIECLINNAGITSFKPFVENSIEEIEQIIDTNLKGAIYTIKSVLPRMIENNNGTIINILSVAAKTIFTNSSVYAASKAGLEIFSKVIREELRDKNIKVINVFPGATSTEIWPPAILNKHNSKMMNPTELAEMIYDVYKNSSKISPEEIVVRPITGDL